jgi:hypothetical protein
MICREWPRIWARTGPAIGRCIGTARVPGVGETLQFMLMVTGYFVPRPVARPGPGPEMANADRFP